MLCEDIQDTVVKSMRNKTYKEALKFKTFRERFNYLHVGGNVGEETFGYNRRLNQLLYRSKIWRSLRDKIIIRDDGCNLGLEGYEIPHSILIHHIVPITIADIEYQRDIVYDPNNLICTDLATHNQLHYGSKNYEPYEMVERNPGDTTPWL